MEQIKEAVYLINDERYLHLRENGAGVGFATYNKVTGEPLESGQISEKNLPPDGQNTIPAARNWYLFELSDDDRKAIQQESVKILENIPQAGIGRRRGNWAAKATLQSSPVRMDGTTPSTTAIIL